MALLLKIPNSQPPKKLNAPYKSDRDGLVAKSKRVRIGKKQLKNSGFFIKRAVINVKRINGKPPTK
jgi:hypothetical protein